MKISTKQSRTTVRARRRGMAMIVVVMVMAGAAIMGYAMLASNSLQGQVSYSALQSVSAANMAESGVNVAMYYLQKPTNAPLLTNGYWAGQTNLTFGSGVSGSADVTVTKVSSLTNTYDIVSVGKAVSTDGVTLKKQITARVKVNYEYAVTYAGGFNSSVTFPGGTIINGDIKTNGSFKMGLLSQVNGTVYLTGSLLGTLLPSLWKQVPTTTEVYAPTDPKDYRTYSFNGATYNGVEITASTIQNTTLGPTPTNPGGVYFRQGSLQMNSNVTINGSLIVTSGLTVKGSNNVITPQSGLPGVVVTNDMKMDGLSRSITINGMTWLGAGITQNLSVGSNVTINGTFLSPASTPISTSYLGTMNLTFDKTKAAVPDFSPSQSTPKNVSVVSWN